MKFVSLTLFLIASNCLAANNSSSLEPYPSLSNSLDTHSDELKFYVDFDFSKYATELERKYISIEKASQMCTCELTKLENDSTICLQNLKSLTLYCVEYVHKANLALARLLKQIRLPVIQNSAFDSWKTSGFSASQFIGVVKECVDKDWRDHGTFLAQGALEWHYNSNLYFREVRGDECTSNYHVTQYIGIDFIYRTKDKLNSSDNAQLESCIRLESPYGMCKLARKIVASNEYTWDDLNYIQHHTSSVRADIVGTNKIALMAFLFGEEIRLAWCESELMKLQGPGVARFEVESVLYNNDAKGIVKAYEHCIDKAAVDESVNKKCFDALQLLWNISLHKHQLEVLTNKFDVSTSYHHTLQHQNVVEPAVLLLNSTSYLQKFDNKEFLDKLRKHGFHSYEDALTGKRKLKQLDDELYNRLVMIEKCRDYVQHKDDIAYIRNDFGGLKEKYKEEDGSAHFRIFLFLLELDPDEGRKDQQCFFDLHSRMLVCNTLKTQELLMTISNNKQSSQLLIEFCLNLVSGIPISTCINLFHVQRKSSEYKLFLALRPSTIKAKQPLVFFQ